MIKELQQPVKITLKELVEHYENFLKECEKGSLQTKETYQRTLREFVKWFPIDKRFTFLTRDVERYKRYLSDVKELKNISIATYIASLRRFFQYLFDIQVIKQNPALRVIGGKRPKLHTRTYLSEEEILQLYNSITTDEQGLRDKAIISLMCECGLSEQEIIYAKIEDMDTTKKLPTLVVQGKGKKAKDTNVELSQNSVVAINEYLKLRYKNKTQPPQDPIFISTSPRNRGKSITARGVREAVSRWLIQSGVKGSRERELTPFSLRHSAGVRFVLSGMSVEEVMKRMRVEWRPTALLYFKMANVVPPDNISNRIKENLKNVKTVAENKKSKR